MTSDFTGKLLNWHRKNPRPLPWSGEKKDPYRIWLSEIIMQQTRVEQGTRYYEHFVRTYPDVFALAAASQDDILRSWEGLGYYTRARNLHKAAQHIVETYDGNFPDNYDDILSLPGVGPYSAAAISSFAFDLPYAVVDGNVKRVIARYFGITDSIDLPATYQKIQCIAQCHLPKSQAGLYNQAIMNFGALVCKPKNPSCDLCPLSTSCFAFKHQQTGVLPVRIQKKKARFRFFHFVVMHHKNRILMKKRTVDDIWHGLYSPPVIERSSSRLIPEKAMKILLEETTGAQAFEILHTSDIIKQQLTHQTIIGRFYHVSTHSISKNSSEDHSWIEDDSLSLVGKPAIVVKYFSLASAKR